MIDYSENWLFLLLFKYRGSVFQKSLFIAVPAALVAFLIKHGCETRENFREDMGIDLIDAQSSQLWAASTAVLVLMLNVRTNRAISRFWEGTGLLHQMRGEWFDSVSCCVTFSTTAKPSKEADVMTFRHTIVRLMSLCHASALEEIAGNHEGPPVTIDLFGLSDETLNHLKRCKAEAKPASNSMCSPFLLFGGNRSASEESSSRQSRSENDYDFNRVEVILHMTQTLIVRAYDQKVLDIPPPILSRVFQTLSRGFVNLLNAKKITDTRFPFPYAQLLSFLLLVHVVVTPVLVTETIENKWWAMVFSFLPSFGMCALNYVAIELENPFGDDDNDLPLLHFQKEMNNCLMMLLEDHADMQPGTSRACMKDFRTLVSKMRQADNPLQHARISEYVPPQEDEPDAQSSCFGTEPDLLDGAPSIRELDDSVGNAGSAELAGPRSSDTMKPATEESPEAPRPSPAVLSSRTPSKEVPTEPELPPEEVQADPIAPPAPPPPQAQAAPAPPPEPPPPPPLPLAIAPVPAKKPQLTRPLSYGVPLTAAQSKQQMARIIVMLERTAKTVATMENAFKQWGEKAEEHAKAVRKNTEALSRLNMVAV